VAQKFTEDTKAKGIAVPALLQQVHPTSGLPLILSIAQDAEGDKEETKVVENAIVKSLAGVKTCEVTFNPWKFNQSFLISPSLTEPNQQTSLDDKYSFNQEHISSNR